jgi:hypothetical protein
MRSGIKLVVLMGWLIPSGLLYGQAATGEVLGTVVDASKAPISKATVTLQNQDTGIQAKTTTTESGNYDFFNVQVGLYTITVEATGFSKFDTKDVRVDVGARQRVDANLQVGATSNSVEVSGAAAILDTDSSEHAQIINTAQIVELPLNGRNYSDLALLSTNVIRSPIGVAFGPTGTPREAAFNVNGMRSTYNNFLLDGIDNNAYSTSNQGFSSQVVQPSPDAIAEFKVITSNFSAEYGRVSGGVITAAMRSGTNAFHGTAYEFLRNTSLNAVGFQFTTPAVFYKPTLQRNQFGFSIGGPFIKNKLFFFADYEGYRQLQRYLNFDSIPSLAERGGVLPQTVYDPLNKTTYAAGTQIPISVLNPFAATVLNNLPAPTGPGVANNLEALLLIRDYSDKYDAKLNYQINDRMSTFVRFSQRKDLPYYQPDISGPDGGNTNGYIHATQQQAAIGYTWAVTASSVFDARFGFDHVLAGKEPAILGGPSMEQLYGIPGLPTSPNLTGGLNSQSISGFSLFGRQATNPQFQNPTSFDPKLSYSWIKGRHAFKAGYEFLAIRTEVLDINPLYGQDTYAGQFSKPLGSTASDATTFNLADFIFGLPSTIQLGNNVVTNLRQHITALYFMDDYRVNSKLTLNLGLRWEFATPIWERDNQWSNFDPATNTIIRASNGSLYNRALVNPYYKDFGPRVGFAYTFDPKTVIRAGYGISYNFDNRPGSAQEGINAPLALFGLQTQSIPAGGPVPASFLTTQNSFTSGLDVPANFNPIVSNIDYIPANTKWPMTQSWVFSVQRQLAKDTVLEVAYNGNHSTNLPIIADYNQAVPNLPGQTLGVQARRPDQAFGAITWLDPSGNNNFNGLSIRLEHRMTGGLYFLNSFTWSHAIGDSEQALEYLTGVVEANVQNIHNLDNERGPTSYDIKLNNVTSIVYELPFGKGRKYGAHINPVLDAVAGGWQLGVINTVHTGLPINVYYSPSTANDNTGLTADYRGENFLRPNVSGASISQSTNALVNNYFAGYVFTTPPASAPFGNLGRNAFRQPGFEQPDLSVNKSFRIHEGISLQFRSEFFNVINKTNFGPPNNISTSSAFGQIRTTYPPRQIQFALKLIF